MPVPVIPLVVAPTPPQAHAVSDWYTHTVPLSLRPLSPFSVRVLTPAELRASLQDAENAAELEATDGVFDTDPDTITLREGKDGLPDWFTFAHELGHLLWARRLSRTDRAAYSDLYNRERNAHRLVTPYAAESAEEAWAESYSFYVCAAPMLAARDPQSFQFVRRWAAAHS